MRAALSRLLLIAISLAMVLGCADSATSPTGPSAPTILLITVDGLRPERVGALGGSTPTPSLQRLVDDGVSYPDVWTVTPLTRPAVATYLTGQTPPVHGVRDDTSTALVAGAPTLASVLGARGYATAAFPDSSALGFDSGLLEAFDVVDDAPVAQVGPLTWLPVFDRSKPTKRNLETWIGSVGETTPAFVWAHFSHALIEQLVPEDVEIRPSLADLDERIGGVLDVMKIAGRYDDAWVVVAVTSADVTGGADVVAGPGMSLAPAAIRVPLFIKPPRGTRLPEGVAAWAPDVATTLAKAAGGELPSAAGIDLRADAPPTERIRLAWSGAPRDQFGWRPLFAAGQGGAVLIAGVESAPVRRSDGDVDPAVWERLARALDDTGMPAAPSVSLDGVRALLEKHGAKLDPVSAAGRPFDDAKLRRQVGRDALTARTSLMSGKLEDGLAALQRVLDVDPDNLGARIVIAQLPALRGESEAALELILPAVERYPDHPDVLHWLAHALWGRSVPDASALLTAVEPFKPQEGDVLYDLACARSLAGELGESEAFLRRAIEAGFRHWPSIDSDPDLRNLRESGRFAAVMREYRR